MLKLLLLFNDPIFFFYEGFTVDLVVDIVRESTANSLLPWLACICMAKAYYFMIMLKSEPFVMCILYVAAGLLF